MNYNDDTDVSVVCEICLVGKNNERDELVRSDNVHHNSVELGRPSMTNIRAMFDNMIIYTKISFS